jgi:hypothetical protein
MFFYQISQWKSFSERKGYVFSVLAGFFGKHLWGDMKLLSRIVLSREIDTFAKRGKVNITGVFAPRG